MQYIDLGGSGLRISRLIYGCMRIVGDGKQPDRERGKRAVRAALDAGFSTFDHADIYAGGACEALFGELLAETPGLRERIVLIGKCGIRFAGDDGPKRYDFSRDHLISSVENSLSRLGTDRLDVLLLHRPDYLFDPHEVADAFDRLQADGKVRHFGVSNFTPSQVDMLRAACSQPLRANQVEINLHNIDALENGTLDQCLRLGMTPQAWCPLAGAAWPAWGNTFSPEDEKRIADEIGRQGERYGVSPWQLALAWLLRHPSGIAPLIGSTTPARIADAPAALAVPYTREDWYRLLEARNGSPVP